MLRTYGITPGCRVVRRIICTWTPNSAQDDTSELTLGDRRHPVLDAPLMAVRRMVHRRRGTKGGRGRKAQTPSRSFREHGPCEA